MDIKAIIKKLFPLVIKKITDYRVRERKCSYGIENPDKTFYIYGVEDNAGGLWWHINKVLMHSSYADKKGYLVVVDMKNYSSQYHNKGELGAVNVWEEFFEQPSGYSLDDIKNSRNIIISKKAECPSPEYLMGNTVFYDDQRRIAHFHYLFNKYIKFNSRTREYLDNKIDMLFNGKGKILGVLCRGTDYVLKKPKGHPIQPNPEDVIKDSKEIMKKYGCSYIFLATEDLDIFNLFKSTFSDQLLYIDQRRVSKKDMDGNNYLSSYNMKMNEDKEVFSKAIEYFTATYLLSRCNCYLGGRTGGSKGVLIMTEEFEYKKIYNIGLYE